MKNLDDIWNAEHFEEEYNDNAVQKAQQQAIRDISEDEVVLEDRALRRAMRFNNEDLPDSGDHDAEDDKWDKYRI